MVQQPPRRDKNSFKDRPFLTGPLLLHCCATLPDLGCKTFLDQAKYYIKDCKMNIDAILLLFHHQIQL